MSDSPPDLKAVFSKALEFADPAERARYVEKACAGNAALRAEVEGLLGALAEAGSFLEAPAVPGRPTGLVEGPGTVIGPYTLRELIGEGGMAAVFIAEQAQPVQRRVALKIV